MNRSKIRALLLLPVVLILIFPIIMLFANSFMTAREIESHYYSAETSPKLVLIPETVSFEQYIRVLIKEPAYLKYFWNSVFITFFILAGQLVVASMAAFGFSVYRFRGRELLFFLYIVVMMMPFIVTLVPNYIIAGKMGILNRWSSVILPGIFSPFGVFLLRQFMKMVPFSYIESARLESCSDPGIYLRIMLPLVKSGLVALIILAGVDSWNMVEQPLIFLSDSSRYPLSMILSRINLNEAGIAFAASSLYMIPFLLLFLHNEKALVAGIAMTGVKE